MSALTFGLQLQRFRALARLAVARSGVPMSDEAFAEADAELLSSTAQLRDLRDDAERPDLRLATTLGLSPDQLDFVWAVIARAADPMLLSLLQVVCGPEVRRGLSLAQYVAIASIDAARGQEIATMLSPLHPLVRDRFVHGADPGEVDACSPLVVYSRLWLHLRGDDHVDPLGTIGGRVNVPEGLRLDTDQQGAAQLITRVLSSLEPIVVVIEGPAGSGRRTAAAHAASIAGRSVVSIDLSRISTAPGALEEALAALSRECVLADAIPLIAEADEVGTADGERGPRQQALARTLEATPGPIIVTTQLPGFDVGVRSRRLLRLGWPTPGTSARRALWDAALVGDGDALGGVLDEVALRYRLGAGLIASAAASARMVRDARGGDALAPQDVVQGIRSTIAERLGELAQRVDIRQTWDDLVLPGETMDDVQGLIARVKHAHLVYEQWGFKHKMPRGLGVAALFSGPPGTGKTMVAGLLARELDLELYQVDLSKVVSKWVGETEKQLAKIFAAAEAGHALLLFDEADSLFARRTEVKSAVDRYANLEVNYLLQRIESFGGVTILTTNLDTSIDPALRRRLASHIVFQLPEHAESMKLWERMLSSSAPTTALSLDELPRRYPAMTGANIRNAVLAAAFMAAAESAPISQRHLERAARGEYRAMGRVLS